MTLIFYVLEILLYCKYTLSPYQYDNKPIDSNYKDSYGSIRLLNYKEAKNVFGDKIEDMKMEDYFLVDGD